MVSVPTSIDARGLLCAQMKIVYDLMDSTIADCSQEIANTRLAGGTTNSISVVYLHVVSSDDYMFNQMARGGAMLYESDGWQRRIGIENVSAIQTDTRAGLVLDMNVLREYAAAVRATTERFLEQATEAELAREVESFLGAKVSVAEFLGTFAVTHLSEHWGEISALKGVLGLKGLPF